MYCTLSSQGGCTLPQARVVWTSEPSKWLYYQAKWSVVRLDNRVLFACAHVVDCSLGCMHVCMQEDHTICCELVGADRLRYLTVIEQQLLKGWNTDAFSKEGPKLLSDGVRMRQKDWNNRKCGVRKVMVVKLDTPAELTHYPVVLSTIETMSDGSQARCYNAEITHVQ